MTLKALYITLIFATTSPVFGQVRCTMPNGVVITQQFATACPRGAIQDPNFGAPLQAQPAPTPNTAPITAVTTQTPAAQSPANQPKEDEMTLLRWGIVAALLFALYRAVTGPVIAANKQYLCMTCGYEGTSKIQPKGSLLIEIILWFAILLPGLIYSIWRHTNRKKACKQCGATNLVSPDAPLARAVKRHYLDHASEAE